MRKNRLVPVKLLRACAVACVFLSIALTAGAQPVIDQEQVLLGNTFLAVGGGSEEKLAQAFTAGRSGYLTDVTLPIGCTAGAILNVTIQEVTAAGPTGVILASESVPGVNLPPPAGNWRIIEFCDPARVVGKRQYALTLQVANPATDSCGVEVGPAGDTYTPGLAYFDARPNPPGWLAMLPESDLAFQTYLDSSKKVCCGRKAKN
jgi:hypothetical protein